jgi:hypothetical protein
MSRKARPPDPRKLRASDCIEKAITDNKPLPLEVILKTMWHFLDEVQRLEASGDPDDVRLSRLARYLAFRAAVVALPYVHARIAPVAAADFEDGDPVDSPEEDPDARARQEALFTRQLNELSLSQFEEFYDRLVAGESRDAFPQR